MNILRQDDLRYFAAGLFKDMVLPLLASKGDQYVGEQKSALSNFVEAANFWDDTEAEEILRQCSKHFLFLRDWSKREDSLLHAEMAARSAKDILIFMVLLLFHLRNESGSIETGTTPEGET